MNFYEARHFIELIKKSFAGQDFMSWLAAWKAKERALLSQRLEETPLYQLDLPFIGSDMEVFNKIRVCS